MDNNQPRTDDGAPATPSSSGTDAGGGDRVGELMGLMNSNPKEYASDAIQSELRELIGDGEAGDDAANDAAEVAGAPDAGTQARMDKLMGLMHSDAKRYASAEVQDEIRALDAVIAGRASVPAERMPQEDRKANAQSSPPDKDRAAQVQKRIAEIMGLLHSAPDRYAAVETQQELEDLLLERDQGFAPTTRTGAPPPIPTGKNDKPEDVAAFREKWGVPETPDKYVVPKSDGAAPIDDQLWREVALPQFHASHFSQKQLDVIGEVLQETEVRISQAREREMEHHAKRTVEVTLASLKKEYGGDADEEIQSANRFFRENFGEQAGHILNLQLADGSCLGDNLNLVRGLIELRRNLE